MNKYVLKCDCLQSIVIFPEPEIDIKNIKLQNWVCKDCLEELKIEKYQQYSLKTRYCYYCSNDTVIDVSPQNDDKELVYCLDCEKQYTVRKEDA